MGTDGDGIEVVRGRAGMGVISVPVQVSSARTITLPLEYLSNFPVM